jgi:hypothetical protein
MSLEFKIAETEAEKNEIFHLRYNVYIKEMNRPAHADHNAQVIKDWMDEYGTLFCAKYDGKIVGTARANLMKHGPIEFEKEYRLSEFGKFYPENMSTTTKLIFDPEYRMKTTLPSFLLLIYQFGIDNGIEYDFLNANPPLDRFYEKLGYRKYQPNFRHPEFGEVVPMVLVLNDLTYLRSIRSPLVWNSNGKTDNELAVRNFHSVKDSLIHQ